MHRWWNDEDGQRYWLEITDREDLGANLHAPQRREAGDEFWGYSLIREVQPGEVVLHLHKDDEAVVGYSIAKDVAEAASIVWGARGTAARTSGIQPYERAGWRVPLEDFTLFGKPLPLDAVRARREEVLGIRDALEQEHGAPIYFPFVPYQDSLRPVQSYFVKWPRQLNDIFADWAAQLADGGARADGNPVWVRDEVVLALNLYVKSGGLNGGRLLARDHPDVVALSRAMNDLPIHPLSKRASSFRNPAGVAFKLANFRAIERDVKVERGIEGAGQLPKGMASYSALDLAVFEEFYDKEFAGVAEEASAILATEVQFLDAPKEPIVEDRPVERAEVEAYEASGTEGGSRSRSEHALVERYRRWMADERGKHVVSRRYRIPGAARPLLCDLYVKGIDLLVEAKASDSRPRVRMAVGQLLDYRRFERDGIALAVLLPHQPSEDIKAYLRHVGIAWICPPRTGPGFVDSADGSYC